MYIFLEIYKKFDGPMHPEYNHDKLKELQSKEDSQQSWWKSFTRLPGAVAKFIRNRVTSFTESDVKHLPIVKPYLEPYCQFITGENDLYLVPLEVIDEVVYIVESLIKNHFSVEGSHRMLIASDVKKVHMQYWYSNIAAKFLVYNSCFRFLIRFHPKIRDIT